MKIVKILLTILILSLLFIGGKNIYSKYITSAEPTNLDGLTFNPSEGEPVVAETVIEKKVTHMENPPRLEVYKLQQIVFYISHL